MKTEIINVLKRIEKECNVKILYAVESGSRAWGFASPDSDFDVRFIYVRPEKEYLKLEKTRDVIELPLNAVLDINGWDLGKTLGLLHGSNPTLFEWFSSPIVYIETDFAKELRSIMYEYFSSKKSLYHYISMADGNYRGYLKTDNVRAKKYFYVLRPVLACRWVLERQTAPPMLFSELAAAELPPELKNEVDRLLALKINSPEVRQIPRIDVLNGWLDCEITAIKAALTETDFEERSNDWERLNNLFLIALKTYAPH